MFAHFWAGLPVVGSIFDWPPGEKMTEHANMLMPPGREDVYKEVLQRLNGWLPNRRNGRWRMMLDNIHDDTVFNDDPDGRLHEEILPHQAHEKILNRF